MGCMGCISKLVRVVETRSKTTTQKEVNVLVALKNTKKKREMEKLVLVMYRANKN
jgi:hypothetical protein